MPLRQSEEVAEGFDVVDRPLLATGKQSIEAIVAHSEVARDERVLQAAFLNYFFDFF